MTKSENDRSRKPPQKVDTAYRSGMGCWDER